MSIRPVKRVIKSKPTLEGADVRLSRAFGLATPRTSTHKIGYKRSMTQGYGFRTNSLAARSTASSDCVRTRILPSLLPQLSS